MTEHRDSSADPRTPIQRYFAGLTENTFQSQLGVVDPPMIDYLAELLLRSVRTDVVHKVRSVTGRPLMSVHEMVAEASARLGDAKRELHRHIGDFTLFWAGIYPEALRDNDEERSGKFETYCSFGKRSYRIASEIATNSDEGASSTLLERLSDRFDLCCYGLREVRRQWESGDEEFGPGSILLN